MAPLSFSSAAAVLLAATPAVQALGKFSVKNGCSQAIKLSVTKGADLPQDLGEVQPNESSQQFEYEVMAPGFGVNFAICPSDKDLSKSMLFEYSITSGKVWYDLSNIVVSDSYPELFQNGGVSIVPSKPHSEACAPVNCPPGSKQCHEAYWQSDDNWAVKNCPEDQDTVLETCSGSGNDEDADTSDPVNSSSGDSSSDNSSPPPSYNPPEVKAADNSQQGNNNDDDINNNNNDNATPLKESDGGKVYVPQQQQNGAFTTVVVAATETMTVMGGEPTGKMMHRRHVHGHAHHHA